MPPNNSNLIWIDLEMTGLDPDQERIIEIATVVTDTKLNVIAEGPSYAIHQSDSLLSQMGEWCTHQHTQSGLVERVKKSQINEAKAEADTLAFLANYVPAGASPLCGNSNHLDRRFLRRYMPKLEQYFHYRHLDVSSFKILAQLWAPEVAQQLNKETKHLALDDVYDSISELRFYRDRLLKC